MKTLNLRLLAALFAAFTVASAPSAFAQKAYAGTYYASFGVGVGPAAGAFAYGGATVFSSGLMSVTFYYPGNGASERFTGYVDRFGVLRLDSPNLLTARILKSGKLRFLFGVAGSPVAGGNFFLTNYL
jgi:hypothetical protein